MEDRYRAHRIQVRFRGGSVEVHTGVQAIRPTGKKALLVAGAALFGPVPRERWAALLWPDADPGAARTALRQLLLRVSRAGVPMGGDPVAFDVEVAIDDDGPGDPFAVPDPAAEGELGELLTVAQERRRAAAAHDAARAWRDALDDGRGRDATLAARRWLAADPRALDAHLALLRAHEAAGDPGALLGAYAHLRELLARTVEADPPPEATELARRAAGAAASSGLRHAVGLGRAGMGLVRQAESGGWIDEGAKLVRQAIARAETPAERGALRIGLAWLEHQAGRNERAETSARLGLAELGGAGGAAEGYYVLGSIARHRGRWEEARDAWRRALADVEAAGPRSGGAVLHLDLAQVEDALGRPAAARPHYRAAYQAARETGDVRTECIVLNNLAHDALAVGKPVEAGRLAERAASLAPQVDDRQLEAYVAEAVARTRLANGDARAARSWAAKATETADEVGDAVVRIEGLATLAAALQALDDTAGARRVREEAVRQASATGYGPGLARLEREAEQARPGVTPPSRPAGQAEPGREERDGEGPEMS